MKLFRPSILFLLLLVTAFVPRLLWLNTVPTGISNDELDYVMNAKTIWYTGRGLTGATSPINITPEYPFAELPSLLIAPVIGPFPFSLFLARLPFALLGVATVLLLVSIVRILLGPGIAFATGLLAAINPWNIFFSRTTYDAPVTTFFLLLAFRLMLSGDKKRILISILPLFAAFHTYMGMMVLFPFFVITIAVYTWRFSSRRQYAKQYVAVILMSVFFVIRYLVFLPSSPASVRMGEVSSPSSIQVTNIVNNERRLSLANPLIPIYANKGIVFFKQTLENYANAFSPGILFFHGDSKHIFTVFAHGLLYITDPILILLGFCYLYKTKKRQWNLLLVLLALAPLPAAISALPSYASRVYLLQPILLTYAGTGIYAMLEKRKRHHTLLIALALIILYGVQYANFAVIYFLRNPVHNSESYSFSTRIASSYATRESAKGRSVTFLSDKPTTLFKHYSFYTNLLTSENVSAYMSSYKNGSLSNGGVRWIGCPEKKLPEDSTLILSGDLTLCPSFIPPPGKPMIIANLADGGSLLKIYNGKTCSNLTLDRFPHDIHFGDLSVERLTDERFCTKLITQY